MFRRETAPIDESMTDEQRAPYLYTQLATKALEKLPSVGTASDRRNTLENLKKQVRTHVKRANRWGDIRVRLGLEGVVFANWMRLEWFTGSDEDFAKVLQKLSGKGDWLRNVVCNILGSNSPFYDNRDSRSFSLVGFSAQEDIEESQTNHSDIGILRKTLSNAQQTIDSELERKHKMEVMPVFRLECA